MEIAFDYVSFDASCSQQTAKLKSRPHCSWPSLMDADSRGFNLTSLLR